MTFTMTWLRPLGRPLSFLGLSREAADSKNTMSLLFCWSGMATTFVDTLLAIAGAAVGLLAFMRAWASPANAYDFAGKRPKRTPGWLLTGGSAAVSLFAFCCGDWRR